MKKPYMPPQQGPYLKWHDNLTTVAGTADGATVGITTDEVTTLTTNNDDLKAKSKAASDADIASKAAHLALTQALQQSRAAARQIVGRAKKHQAYTPVIGEKLQAIGAEDTTDMTQKQPTLNAVVNAGGEVDVGFDKLLAEGVHFYSRRGAETVFSYLASETHSPYVDNRVLLVAGQPEIREYKGVYFIGQAEIGLESNIIQATARP